MNNNPFDPNMFKNLENVMKGFQQPQNNNGLFNFNKIKKYLITFIVSIFVSGFALGLAIGLLF
jgi:hypothetical protein